MVVCATQRVPTSMQPCQCLQTEVTNLRKGFCHTKDSSRPQCYSQTIVRNTCPNFKIMLPHLFSQVTLYAAPLTSPAVQHLKPTNIGRHSTSDRKASMGSSPLALSMGSRRMCSACSAPSCASLSEVSFPRISMASCAGGYGNQHCSGRNLSYSAWRRPCCSSWQHQFLLSSARSALMASWFPNTDRLVLIQQGRAYNHQLCLSGLLLHPLDGLQTQVHRLHQTQHGSKVCRVCTAFKNVS